MLHRGAPQRQTQVAETPATSTFRTALRRGFIAPFVISTLFAGVIVWQLETLLREARWVSHTDAVISKAEEVALNLVDGESALRGYLLLGDQDMLTREGKSFSSAMRGIRELQLLVADNPSQASLIAQIEAEASQWNRIAMQEVQFKKTGGDYLAVIRAGRSRKLMDDIRENLGGFLKVEHVIRRKRASESHAANISVFVVITLTTLAVAALFAALGGLQIRAVARMYQSALDQEASARAEAERASTAKDEFLSFISHELRNPLNSLVLSIAALRRAGSRDEHSTRLLATMDRASSALAKMIEQLLDSTRIAAGKIALQLERVDAARIVAEAVESARQGAERKHIALTVDAPPVGTIQADPLRLQQVIGNLLSNAIKFTPESGTVGVELREVRGAVRLQVNDNGEGIQPEHLNRIFERFYQVTNNGSFRSGLGLGLSISKYLVEAHHGTLSAASEGRGKGASFTLILPRGATPRADPEQA